MIYWDGSEELTLEYPLQILSFIDSDDAVRSLFRFVLNKAVEFNERNERENEEIFFPVAIYNEKGGFFEVEYDFFVEAFWKWVRINYNASTATRDLIFNTFVFGRDHKDIYTSELFFRGILGNYYRSSTVYYSTKMTHITIVKLLENMFGNYAVSKFIFIRDTYVVNADEFKNELVYPSVSNAAFGKAKTISHPEYKNAKKVFSIGS